MKAMVMGGLGLSNLALRDVPDPKPGPGQVLVRMKAASLNFRDLLTLDPMPVGNHDTEQTTRRKGASEKRRSHWAVLLFSPSPFSRCDQFPISPSPARRDLTWPKVPTARASR